MSLMEVFGMFKNYWLTLLIILLFVPVVSAEMSWVYPIDFGVNDCYDRTIDGGSHTVYCTTNLIQTIYDRANLPASWGNSYFTFNLSNYTGVPTGWQVSNMSVNYYMQSYTTTGKPAPSKTYWGIITGNVSGVFSSTNTAVAYHRWGLPTTMWNNITTSPILLTLGVDDPTTGSRVINWRAYENGTATRAYLNLTFKPNVPPIWNNNQTSMNTTNNGTNCWFAVNMTDDNSPNKYIFSLYNGSTWANSSWTTWTNNSMANLTRFINETNASVIKWKWFINDTMGLQNVTDEWQITIQAPADAIPDNAPNGTLLTPANNTNFNTQWINFTCIYNDDIQLSNISLWTNTTGTWEINQTINAQYEIIEQQTNYTCEDTNSGANCNKLYFCNKPSAKWVSYFFDNLWDDCYFEAAYVPTFIRFNATYNKPYGATNLTWKIKSALFENNFDQNIENNTFTIPSNCFTENNNEFNITITQEYIDNLYDTGLTTKYSCDNENTYFNISTNYALVSYYEEQVNWSFTNKRILNVSLQVPYGSDYQWACSAYDTSENYGITGNWSFSVTNPVVPPGRKDLYMPMIALFVEGINILPILYLIIILLFVVFV
jgi:hypothetical protein